MLNTYIPPFIFRRFFFFITVFALCFQQNTRAQSTQNEKPEQECIIENAERIFVHLDKKEFISGEFLYYKSYLRKASSFTVHGISRIVYYQILDPDMKQVLTWCSNANETGSPGSIKLPDSLFSGVYTLVAFTNWMRNFPDAYYFRTKLIIINISDDHTDSLTSPAGVGNAGVKPFNFTDNAVWQVSPEDTTRLQKITDKSPVLTLLRLTEDSIIILAKIKKNKNNFSRCHVKVFTHGYSSIDTIVNISGGGDTLFLQTKSWKQGIAKISLESINENTATHIFVLKKPTAKVILTPPDTIYQKRSQIHFTIKLAGFSPADTLFASLSVSKGSPFQQITGQQDIVTDLLVKGEFADGTLPVFAEDRIDQIPPFFWDDLRMYTDSAFTFKREDRGFVLAGHTGINGSSGHPGTDYLLLSKPDTIPFIDYANVDTSGNFYFLINPQQDNKTLILQQKNNSNIFIPADISLKSKFPSPVSGESFSQSLNKKQRMYLKDLRNIQLVNDIYYDSLKPKKGPVNEDAAGYQRIFYGIPDRVVKPAEFTPLPDFSEITANILPGVHFRRKDAAWYISVFNPSANIFFPEKDFVLLNGVPFSDLNYIYGLQTKDIKEIRIVYNRVFFGDIYFDGIVDIETYDGKIPDSYIRQKTLLYTNKVNPNTKSILTYSIPSSNHQPYLHPLLYWNPSLTVPVNQTIEVKCYSSDLTGKYNISLQGITKKGIPVVAKGSFTITNK